jgi:hypothetical protein
VVDGVTDARGDDDRTRLDGASTTAADLDRAADAVIGLLLRLVPGAAHAGVLVERDGEVVRYGDRLVEVLDELQTRLGEGPGQQTTGLWTPVLVGDLASREAQWPRFVPGASELGVRGALAVPVRARGAVVGRIDVVATEVGALTDASLEVTALVAAHLSATATLSAQVRQLEVALRSRDQIGQAKGILMERHGIDADRAFEVLVRYSRSGNTKLREVADALVATRSLPDDQQPVDGGSTG